MIGVIVKVQKVLGRWRIRRFLRTLDNETLMRHYTVAGAIAVISGDERLADFKQRIQPLFADEMKRRDWSEMHARICGKA